MKTQNKPNKCGNEHQLDSFNVAAVV